MQIPVGNPAVSLKSLSKSYSRFKALQGITVDFPQGVTGLLGPNGAGKSTLIKILLGLLKATSGSASVFGQDVWKQRHAIRHQVGYMPEDDCYLPSLTGVECVQFAARLSGFAPRESLRRSHEILDFCGAGQERYRTVETYSVGMRQKLKFAQSLVHDPELLILDEPTSGLDPDEREAMLRRIQWLATEHHKSIVICTHILPDVQQVSNFVVILYAGELRVAQKLDELIRPTSPAIEVQVPGATERLTEELSKLGLTTLKQQDGTVVINGDSDEIVRDVWQVSHQLGLAIRSLRPAIRTMESIFLGAIQTTDQDRDHANS